MKKVAVLAALLAAALAGGAGRSEAVFVASTTNAANSFGTAAVFNTVSISLADPGTPLSGTVPLSATATSDLPIASVRFQSAPAGSGNWTDRCTDTEAPYTCDWNTAALPAGSYDLRAIALDANDYAQSDTVTSRRVENTPPNVTLTNPGSPLTGNRTLTATASDTGGTGVAAVAFEYRASPSGAWTEICSDDGYPYSCPWATAARPDGLYDLRATARDNAGNTNSSTVTGRRVDNTAPTVAIVDDGLPKRDTISAEVAYGDGDGSGVAEIEYEYRASGSGGWLDACRSAVAPFTCTVDSSAAPDGLYDIRAIATDGANFRTTSATVTIRVDNTSPSSATIAAPASPLGTSVTLSGTGADSGSGVASMRFEYRTGGGEWSTACSDSGAPFSCSWSTAGVADGTYELRSVAIDGAGNTRYSTSTTRVVDTGGPAVSLTSPGSRVRGTVTVPATATDPSGVQSVAIQYARAGTGTFTTICTDSTAAYSCAWNLAAIADGAYDLRAVATDTLGRSTTSALVGTTVDKTSPTGTDVQSTNGGINDRLDAGDTVIFTYSEAMTPGSILPGWTGASAATVTVRVADNGTRDLMTFYDGANQTALNLLAPGTSLQINGDHISSTTARFTASMTRSGGTIRVQLTALAQGTVRSTATGSTPMVWQPSEAATNAAGRFCMPTAVTESGAADVDF